MRIHPFCRFIAMLLALVMFYTTLAPSIAQAQQAPPPPPPPGDPQPIVLVLCVIAIAGIIVGVGGCAAKKLMKQKPRTFEPEEPPPSPPPATNAPPKKKLTLALTEAQAMALPITAGAGTDNCGMVRWDITETPSWLNSPTSYLNTVTSNKFTDIITTTIQATTNMVDWSIVGSRMIWYSEIDQSSLINYLDPHGAVVSTRYVPKAEATAAPYDSDSSVILMPWELSSHPARFYRLAAADTNHIAVLTE